jgi:hypothetical protein
MAVQYGQPTQQQIDAKKQAGYERKDTQPGVKEQDPRPPANVVEDFHHNAPVDTRPEDIHHRLGPAPNSASPGNHSHNGADSVLLLDGFILTGSKGGNAAVASIIQALVRLGAKDSTT